MVTNSSGIEDGIRYACGARQKKRRMLSRDKASAKVFWTPGTWAATAWNLYLASRKNRQRRRYANVGSLALPAEVTDTTAALLQLNCTMERLQVLPQIAAARIMGSISLAAISYCWALGYFSQVT